MDKLMIQTPPVSTKEYKAFLNRMKQKYSDVIEEADNNVHKWFELFVDKGDETQTVDSGDTFDQAIAHFELHVKNWGADNLFMDVWTDKDMDKTVFPLVDISLWSKEDMQDSFSIEIN